MGSISVFMLKHVLGSKMEKADSLSRGPD